MQTTTSPAIGVEGDDSSIEDEEDAGDEAGAEKVATHTGSKWWWQHVTGRKKRQ